MKTDDKPDARVADSVAGARHEPAPERRAYTRDSDGLLDLHGDLLNLIDGIIAVVPAAHNLVGRASQLRSRYDELRAAK